MINFSFPLGDEQLLATLNGNVFLSGVLGNDETVISPGNQSDTGTNNSNTESSTQDNSGSGITDEGAVTGGWLSFLPIIVIYGGLLFAIYFFLFRPQRKRDKQMKDMQSALKIGDNIVTSGGLYGKIVELGQEAHTIEFGSNRGIRVPVRISDILGVKSPVITPPYNKEIPLNDKDKEKE